MNTSALALRDARALGEALAAPRPVLATRLLSGAAAFWTTAMVFGQLVFATYISIFYGRSTLQGRPEEWNKVLPGGYVPGATLANSVLIAHLALALLVTLSGVLQLLPVTRRRWPALHRWNGRFYMTAIAIVSVSGTIMVWRRAIGDVSQNIAMTINAVLCLAFAAIALRHAMARRFDVHRRWALRLLLCANGVFFFRLGLTLWILINRAPVGFDPHTFTGPFLTLLSFAQYLVPLSLLQLYFVAQESRHAAVRYAGAAGLTVLTLLMLAGIGSATLMLWWRHL